MKKVIAVEPYVYRESSNFKHKPWVAWKNIGGKTLCGNYPRILHKLLFAGDYIPSVVEATVENGERSEYDIGAKTKVMSKKTAAMLRDDLTAVITDGTGTAAAPKSVTAAGKTAITQKAAESRQNGQSARIYYQTRIIYAPPAAENRISRIRPALTAERTRQK